MKILIILFSSMMVFVSANAFLGLGYGPELSKFYRPYYMGLRKGLDAEKGLGMGPHMYGPAIPKGTFLGYGKGYPHYYPHLAKERELGFEVGKGLAMYNPVAAKEKAVGAGLGKGLGRAFY